MTVMDPRLDVSHYGTTQQFGLVGLKVPARTEQSPPDSHYH